MIPGIRMRYVAMWCNTAYCERCARRESTYLLHDASFALAKRDMATRLVLDKLDLNLPSFAAGLVVIVIVVVQVLIGTSTLDAAVGIASSERAIAIASAVVVAGGGVMVVFSDFRGHYVWVMTDSVLCLTLTLWGSVWGFSLLKPWGQGGTLQKAGRADAEGLWARKTGFHLGWSAINSTVMLRAATGGC